MSEFHRTSKWGTFTRKARPIIKAQLPLPCVNAGAHPTCTGAVYPDQVWHVGHIRSHHLDPLAPLTLQSVGPSHAKCNTRAGSVEGGKKAQRIRRGGADDKRLPRGGSGW
ncbi:hypothetical protein [Microbacterium sp. SLBN-146]|uniref:hypothetical protein n=1 Tax=Microbacterium sp. SLBN-146 TaxID=2768457 RepID=UPI00114E341B|nr:hypothetical protein [Microbacterium sp. SLBN-146]TQJ31954.1 hypothetical protein FBY39_2443 [Microbacterium sp. SLBN-146]